MRPGTREGRGRGGILSTLGCGAIRKIKYGGVSPCVLLFFPYFSEPAVVASFVLLDVPFRINREVPTPVHRGVP